MTVRHFTPAVLARLQGTQVSSMQDTCVRLLYNGGTPDPYGGPNETYTVGSTLPCGFDPGSGVEELERTQVVVDRPKLRLPLGTVVNPRDRIRITHRFGVLLDPFLDYDVVGEPERGPSGLVLTLVRATIATVLS